MPSGASLERDHSQRGCEGGQGDAGFCVAAPEEALARFGRPEIFNTDQGSQFTRFAFTTVQREAEVRISMGGRGRWMDKVFIERLWRSLKYECVYLTAFETGSELRAGLGKWITYCNTQRPHSGLSGQTPVEAYGRIDNDLTGGVNDNPDQLNSAAELSQKAGPLSSATCPTAGTPRSRSHSRSGSRAGSGLAD